MKPISRQSTASLSARAKRSSLWQMGRCFGLYIVALPLAGYGLGSCIDRFWSGEISWALALGLLGFTTGCIAFWMWIKRLRSR